MLLSKRQLFKTPTTHRQILCSVFVFIFMSNGHIYWRQKMRPANGRIRRTKERKRNTKKVNIKNNHFICYFIVLSENTFFIVIIFRGKVF